MSTEANAECLNEAAVMPPHPEELFSVAEERQRALLLSTAPFSTPLQIHEVFPWVGVGGWHEAGPRDHLSSFRFPRTSAAGGALVPGCARRGLKGLKGTLGCELQLLKGPHMEIWWSQCDM